MRTRNDAVKIMNFFIKRKCNSSCSAVFFCLVNWVLCKRARNELEAIFFCVCVRCWRGQETHDKVLSIIQNIRWQAPHLDVVMKSLHCAPFNGAGNSDLELFLSTFFSSEISFSKVLLFLSLTIWEILLRQLRADEVEEENFEEILLMNIYDYAERILFRQSREVNVTLNATCFLFPSMISVKQSFAFTIKHSRFVKLRERKEGRRETKKKMRSHDTSPG